MALAGFFYTGELHTFKLLLVISENIVKELIRLKKIIKLKIQKNILISTIFAHIALDLLNY